MMQSGFMVNILEPSRYKVIISFPHTIVAYVIDEYEYIHRLWCNGDHVIFADSFFRLQFGIVKLLNEFNSHAHLSAPKLYSSWIL